MDLPFPADTVAHLLGRVYQDAVAQRLPPAVLAETRGLAPLLGGYLAAGCFARERQSLLADAARQSFRDTRAWNVVLLDAAARLEELLAGQGVAVRWLKGVAMIAGHYGEWGLRRTRDLDLLVPEEARELLGERLAARAWRREWHAGRPISDRRHFEHVYLHAVQPLRLELHAELDHAPIGGFRARHVWEMPAVAAAGLTIADPLSLLLHATLHHARNAFGGDLRDVLDIGLLLSGRVPAREAAAAAARHGLGRALYLCLLRVQYHLGLALDEGLAKICEPDERKRALLARLIPPWRPAIIGGAPWQAAARPLLWALLSPRPGRWLEFAAKWGRARLGDYWASR